MQFMQSAHSLLDSVTTDLFTLQQPMQLLLVFGPTASRPSEVYSLAFPALGDAFSHTVSRLGLLLHMVANASIYTTAHVLLVQSKAQQEHHRKHTRILLGVPYGR